MATKHDQILNILKTYQLAIESLFEALPKV